ncbi:MAG: relaxase/mobilization nuclease domain-containing protein [Oscillospiraceae bacterium]|nr:relaxase/mobilization nuclease domain-containing protein [Oscillospiraceae bacterium]
MAATKIFSIKVTPAAALAYISAPSKTDNGRLLATFMCSRKPDKAAEEFAQVRADIGTGKSSVLAQHFIVSFSPGEVTPEKAMEIGKALCEKLLQDQYQYYLAVHTDKDHIHLHCIFNNTNLINGLTFQTLNNQGKVSERMWKKLRVMSDDLCKEYGLSVIQHPETGKGKSYWEWDMTRNGLSWKARLKYAIDEVIKESTDFDDFLQKCKKHGILVSYNPEHKIDLKFMLAEQKERNPRAKFTRAKTLGWFYETKQIKDRIDMYNGIMSYVPRTKIRQTVTVQENKFIRDAVDRGNMKLASIAKNIITKYGVSPDEIRPAAFTAYAQRGHLLSELNSLKTDIDDLKVQLRVFRKYSKAKAVQDELKTLSGRQAVKFRQEHSEELSDYQEYKAQILEWYPDGHTPTADALEQKINALIKERSEKDIEFKAANQKSKDLADAQRTIEEFLRQERNGKEQKRKKNKNGDLE